MILGKGKGLKGKGMAIRRLDTGNKFSRRDRRSLATVSTLPTVKAMVDCFDRYLNLTIADGHASNDTVT